VSLFAMRRELEQKLVERWPSWFNVNGYPRKTRMADGFAHGNGWFNIVWKLCEDLEPLVAEAEKVTGRPFEVLQVKQKLGRLRVYVITVRTSYGTASKPLNWNPFALAKCAASRGSCEMTAFGRCAISMPTSEP
jgi:hypothetical protein